MASQHLSGETKAAYLVYSSRITADEVQPSFICENKLGEAYLNGW